MILLQANQIARHFGAEILFENIHLEISTFEDPCWNRTPR